MVISYRLAELQRDQKCKTNT